MSFFVDLRVKHVAGAMNSANNVFTKAIKQYENAIEVAHKHMSKNNEEKLKLVHEMNKRDLANNELNANISKMTKSVEKIRHIVGE